MPASSWLQTCLSAVPKGYRFRTLIETTAHFFGHLGAKLRRWNSQAPHKLRISLEHGDFRHHVSTLQLRNFDRVHLGNSCEYSSLFGDVALAAGLMKPFPPGPGGNCVAKGDAVFCNVISNRVMFDDLKHMLQCTAGIADIATFSVYAAAEPVERFDDITSTLVFRPLRPHKGIGCDVKSNTIPYPIVRYSRRPSNEDCADFIIQTFVLATIPPYAGGRTGTFGARCTYPSNLRAWLQMIRDLADVASYPGHVVEGALDSLMREEAAVEAKIRFMQNRPVAQLPEQSNPRTINGSRSFDELRILMALELAKSSLGRIPWRQQATLVSAAELGIVTIPIDMVAVAKWKADYEVSNRCPEDDPCLGLIISDHQFREHWKAPQLLHAHLQGLMCHSRQGRGPDGCDHAMFTTFSLVADDATAAGRAGTKRLQIQLAMYPDLFRRLYAGPQFGCKPGAVNVAYLYETCNYTLLSATEMSKAKFSALHAGA